MTKGRRPPLTDEEQDAISSAPFSSVEETEARAVALAHRELMRLHAQQWLTGDEIKSLKTLHEILDRAKAMALKELEARRRFGAPDKA